MHDIGVKHLFVCSGSVKVLGLIMRLLLLSCQHMNFLYHMHISCGVLFAMRLCRPPDLTRVWYQRMMISDR